MPLKTTYEAECDGCGAVEVVTRDREPNVTAPEHLVPPDWTEDKNGDVFCPICTAEGKADV